MGTGTGFVLQFFSHCAGVDKKVDALNIMKGGFPETEAMHLIHAHFDGHAATSWDAIRAFASLADHFVIPIRDPLLALLLAHRRNTIDESFWPAWRRLKEVAGAHRADLLPVDLLAKANTGERQSALDNFSGGYTTRDVREKWATWPVVNSHGDYDLKVLYNEGDVDAIQNAIPPEDWAALRRLEPELRPFLERLGYEKLMWWN